ncbi:chaperone NapD [Azospirillum picis]|uniref:Chaperone NapD n=1 Tax=Azospirillum picis TaxID=488438 RepID=A0ABU0MQL1_9PROT|nr:chaperone NapD [Azospirillum picis]MBP2302186.1 nitrate reductase NapD [Azospirillum picis]MDQ0535765.1 nitrate reductase NapD [Azospirillum picis]
MKPDAFPAVTPAPAAGQDGAERHLASLLLHVRPDRRAAVRAAIGALPGVELHIDQPGKMVVTVEGPHEGWIADRMTALHLLDGVFSAVMVFHHIERAADLTTADVKTADVTAADARRSGS